eukprot:TRINITY_DN1396_c0_g1_i2.p1 TRINITY_DN1396_c0_g1~~TRINITY_DN1396_c0_g1_i2.p1  ORF type:complete len:159 (-),score=0.22 TRINITY_DN1396_c0_g1_i2:192-668(-)
MAYCLLHHRKIDIAPESFCSVYNELHQIDTVKKDQSAPLKDIQSKHFSHDYDWFIKQWMRMSLKPSLPYFMIKLSYYNIINFISLSLTYFINIIITNSQYYCIIDILRSIYCAQYTDGNNLLEILRNFPELLYSIYNVLKVFMSIFYEFFVLFLCCFL